MMQQADVGTTGSTDILGGQMGLVSITEEEYIEFKEYQKLKNLTPIWQQPDGLGSFSLAESDWELAQILGLEVWDVRFFGQQATLRMM